VRWWELHTVADCERYKGFLVMACALGFSCSELAAAACVHTATHTGLRCCSALLVCDGLHNTDPAAPCCAAEMHLILLMLQTTETEAK